MSTPSATVAAPPRPAIDDCWNRIGVYGDASCAELAQYIHCRNCPVYSAAASLVLDRERSEEDRQQATRQFADSKVDEQRSARSAFLFRVGAEWLALPTSVLDEVADLRAIHSLPHRRDGVVLGLANVRGELIVCVSLAQLLGIDSGGEAAASRVARTVHRRLLVLRDGESRLAFPVDEVHGTHRYQDQELQAAPTTVARSTASYSRAMLSWREHAVGLLDDELLFHSLNRSLA